jgi:hypothetical protein
MEGLLPKGVPVSHHSHDKDVLHMFLIISWRYAHQHIHLFNCRTLRKLFKVDPADYMLSLCGDDALRELSSPGKSGSFFYLTNDDRYMIKTMKKGEVKVYFLLSFSKCFLSFI